MKSYDLAVIGSGPGGYSAAIRGAQLGMRVAIIEEDALGGVCLNWGCIPTKAILSAAEHYEDLRHGVPGVVLGGLDFDYGAVIDTSRKAADRMNKGVTSLMKKNRIDVVRGRGKLAGRGRVTVSGGDAEDGIEARHILLATGSTELVLDGVEVDGKRVLTSREALEARDFPGSIVIVGGGAVGLEFAYAYQAYGARVTLVEMAEQILPGFDADIAKGLTQSFTRRDVKVLTRTSFRGVERNGEGVVVTVEGEKGEEELQADQMLLAVGRRALTEDLGLETCGVRVERFVSIGEDFRTTGEGVWAIGDVAGPPLLAHKASHEGVAAVEFMAGERRKGIDRRLIPGNIYCQPQVAVVGLSEEQARAAGHDVRIGKVPFTASGKAVGAGHTEGFVKLVVDSRYGEILGGHILGYGATELIAEVTTAMALESTVKELGESCHAHPTLSETVMEAALHAAGRSINI